MSGFRAGVCFCLSGFLLEWLIRTTENISPSLLDFGKVVFRYFHFCVLPVGSLPLRIFSPRFCFHQDFAAITCSICILGDFNIDLLKAQNSNYSQDFLVSLQSCYLIPTVDKPTRVRSTSATLIDNIFVNNPEMVLVSGNIISDISDHFSQFCILTSAVNQIKGESRKVRDFSKFSSDSFTADIS